MHMLWRRIAQCSLVACLIVWAWPVRACDVPVYRYAMENWAPSPYEVVVFHRGALPAPERALVDALRATATREGAHANVTVTLADLSGAIKPGLKSLWEAQEKAQTPWMVVLYPMESGLPVWAWAGRPTAEAVNALLSSPKRAEAVRRLARGEAAVWLLLESGSRAKDDAAADRLQKDLAAFREEMKAGPAGAEDPAGAEGKPTVPGFSLLRVSRTDPAEAMLVTLLLRTQRELEKVSEPIAFPLFGQGRVLCALPGKEISRANLGDVLAFLLGDCSCEVKYQNPGVDLLVTADWGTVNEGNPSTPILPSLASLPSAATARATAAPPAKAEKPASGKATSRSAAPLAPSPDPAPGRPRRVPGALGRASASQTAAKPSADSQDPWATVESPHPQPLSHAAGRGEPDAASAVAPPEVREESTKAEGTAAPEEPAAVRAPETGDPGATAAPGGSGPLARNAGIAVTAGLLLAVVLPKLLLRRGKRP